MYNKFNNLPTKAYKSYIETSVRGFIKACLSKVEYNRYGLPRDIFDTYKSIIDFIYGYEPAREVKMTLSSISRLKNRKTISRSVPRTVENEGFIKYVKDHYPSFDIDLFFRDNSAETTRKNRSNNKQLVNNSKQLVNNSLIVYKQPYNSMVL
jgi:hypothetical protein